MKNNLFSELPVRSKLRMAQEVGEIIGAFGRGELAAVQAGVHDLKLRALHLGEEAIQHRVLIFAEQVQFQSAYDPWHCVNEDMEAAASKLIEELGWRPPPIRNYLT